MIVYTPQMHARKAYTLVRQFKSARNRKVDASNGKKEKKNIEFVATRIQVAHD